jgi:hypothetical protein
MVKLMQNAPEKTIVKKGRNIEIGRDDCNEW